MHVCHHPRCSKPVPPKMLACKPHWFQLPRRLRDGIWAAYRPGQEIDKQTSIEYDEAFDACQKWWRAKIGSDTEELEDAK